jgi:hypothetical protein
MKSMKQMLQDMLKSKKLSVPQKRKVHAPDRWAYAVSTTVVSSS